MGLLDRQNMRSNCPFSSLLTNLFLFAIFVSSLILSSSSSSLVHWNEMGEVSLVGFDKEMDEKNRTHYDIENENNEGEKYPARKRNVKCNDKRNDKRENQNQRAPPSLRGWNDKYADRRKANARFFFSFFGCPLKTHKNTYELG